ncbi:uncharacterized protein GGS25DRAFT_12262 [Hypoxylon fragiforme]|uniref:uncharacterized protein n=1 Tax=Hypoxylon fragiforme TaxID=63214 RepID=UPI0020C66CC3|nr:uncharacterized protein GGS25DRAFT_12262 [Hypoxylon fragiforme]KAI2613717.1 hypothetical protein GGS25DRAFT_12262 [Hypoxylon fragiforme]
MSNDDDGNDDDPWYIPESPRERKQNSQPNAKANEDQNSLGTPDMVISPNSKKKRRPLQSIQPRTKTRNAAKATAYKNGRASPQDLDESKYFASSKSQKPQRNKRSKEVESRQLEQEEAKSSRQRPIYILDNPGSLNHAEEGTDETCKQTAARSHISEEAPAETIPRDQALQKDLEIAPVQQEGPIIMEPPGLAEARSARSPPEEQIHAAPLTAITAKYRDQEIALPTAAPEVPEVLDEPKESLNQQSAMAETLSENVVRETCHDDHTILSVDKVTNGSDNHGEIDSKENSEPMGKATSSLPAYHSSSGRESQTRNVKEDSASRHVYVGESQHAPTFLSIKANSYKLPDRTAARINRRLVTSDLGSPSNPSLVVAGNAEKRENNPPDGVHQSFHDQPRYSVPNNIWMSLNNDIPEPMQVTSDFETLPPKGHAPPQPTHIRYQVHSPEYQSQQDTVECRHKLNSKPHVGITLSKTATFVGGNEKEYVLPQLHPKSIAFATKISKEQKQADDFEEVDQETTNETETCRSTRKPTWLGPQDSANPRDNHRGASLKSIRSGRSSDLESKPRNEERWENAVNVASDGVIDALHHISTVSASSCWLSLALSNEGTESSRTSENSRGKYFCYR